MLWSFGNVYRRVVEYIEVLPDVFELYYFFSVRLSVYLLLKWVAEELWGRRRRLQALASPGQVSGAFQWRYRPSNRLATRRHPRWSLAYRRREQRPLRLSRCTRRHRGMSGTLLTTAICPCRGWCSVLPPLSRKPRKPLQNWRTPLISILFF